MTKPHCVQLCLAPEIRSALIQFMAKNDLDKEYAALSLLVKALYQERLIEKEVYELYSMRYSRKLVNSEVAYSRLSTQEKITQRDEKQRIDEKTRYFSMVLDQWRIHGEEWRVKKLKEAEEWKEQIPSAKLVLDLGVGQK